GEKRGRMDLSPSGGCTMIRSIYKRFRRHRVGLWQLNAKLSTQRSTLIEKARRGRKDRSARGDWKMSGKCFGEGSIFSPRNTRKPPLMTFHQENIFAAGAFQSCRHRVVHASGPRATL